MISIKKLIELLIVSTKLGLTSFGGPIAHLGYFHEEYVRKRKWIDERSYADLVAISQFLPGPASSQVGIGIGVLQGGILGGIISFIGFTIPSVLILMLFALLFNHLEFETAGWLHGLKIVAIAVVASAILGMAQKLTPDLKRKSIALFALATTLLWQTAYTQVLVIIIAALIGFLIFTKQTDITVASSSRFPISKKTALICIGLFVGLLLLLPLAAKLTESKWIAMFDHFYRSGSLVFGGGHVVLPLLQNEFVLTGMISEETFLAGYSAAQAVPGPLFTFASYLGTAIYGWQGGLLATLAIFLPAFLLIIGFLPFWHQLRTNNHINGALMGVNAAVVGILISAFYQPIWTSTIYTPIDFVFSAILFSMLTYWKLPPWIIVLTGAIGGAILL